MSYLHRIADEIFDNFFGEPVDKDVCREIEVWLNQTYSEATWKVEISDINKGVTLVLIPTFQSVEIETYFRLKY